MLINRFWKLRAWLVWVANKSFTLHKKCFFKEENGKYELFWKKETESKTLQRVQFHNPLKCGHDPTET